MSVLAVCIVALFVIPVMTNPLSKGCQCAIRKGIHFVTQITLLNKMS